MVLSHGGHPHVMSCARRNYVDRLSRHNRLRLTRQSRVSGMVKEDHRLLPLKGWKDLLRVEAVGL